MITKLFLMATPMIKVSKGKIASYYFYEFEDGKLMNVPENWIGTHVSDSSFSIWRREDSIECPDFMDFS